MNPKIWGYSCWSNSTSAKIMNEKECEEFMKTGTDENQVYSIPIYEDDFLAGKMICPKGTHEPMYFDEWFWWKYKMEPSIKNVSLKIAELQKEKERQAK